MNGEALLNISHLKTVLERDSEIRMELTDNRVILLDRSEAEARNPAILKKYRVPAKEFIRTPPAETP